MPNKVKYSKQLAKFICDKVEAGLSVSDIVRKYPEKMPERSTIYKWRRDKPEFKEMFDMAYEAKMHLHIDELYDLPNQPLPTIQSIEDELGHTLDGAMAKSYLNAELQKRRMKIDTLKFIAGKLAPKLVRDLSDKLEVKHEGTGINVILPDWTKDVPQLGKGIVIDGDKDDE